MQDPVDSLPDEGLPICDIKRHSLDKDDFGDIRICIRHRESTLTVIHFFK